jgi:transcriptional regulator GlxA family with amidase domain
MANIVFFVPPGLHMLDMSGPTQAFLAARQLGAAYEISHCSLREEITDSAGLHIGRLQNFADVSLGMGDYLFLPGFSSGLLQQQQADGGWEGVYEWVRQQHVAGATICSVCIGAFFLAKAGLLDGRRCTTHWSVIPLLKKGFPRAMVVDEVLFTGDAESGIYTSAGISSGIDLALHLLEEAHGALFAHKVARDLVVYMRRGQDHPQDSVYLNYRNHLHRGIHQLQDWLIGHLERRLTIDEMAEMVSMSPATSPGPSNSRPASRSINTLPCCAWSRPKTSGICQALPCATSRSSADLRIRDSCSAYLGRVKHHKIQQNESLQIAGQPGTDPY